MPKLYGEDDNKFEIMRDDGEVVTVAKSGLSPGRKKYFSGLPAYGQKSSINAEAVASMDEVVEPKTGQVLQNIQAPPQQPQAPEQAQRNPADLQVNPNDFAIASPALPNNSQQQAPASPLEDYKSAKMEGARLAQEGQARQADEYQNVIQEQNKLESVYDSQRDEIKQKKLEAEQTYKEVSDDYFNSKEIDQERYWNNKSTGEKIVAGIGLVLASMNPQAMKSALSAIDRAVDRDIAAQKLEIMKKKDKMQTAKGLVAEFNKKYGNIDASEQAAKLAALEKAKLKLEMISNQTKSQTYSAKAREAIAEVELKMLEAKQKLEKELEEKQVNIGGYKGTLSNKTEAKEFREAMNNLSTAERSIGRLLEINEQTGKSLSPNLRAEAQTLQSSLIGLLRVPLTGPGAMNESEQKLLQSLIANPTDIFALDSTNKTKLKTLLKTLKDKADTQARNLGLEKYGGVNFKPGA